MKNSSNNSISNTETLAKQRPGERGSALVVALMCMVALFAITFAATKIRVASARDIEDKNAQAVQYWEARSGAATVEASLITDVPSIFDAEMLRAQTAVGGYPLPAFDPPQITLNYSRPVLNPDGSISNNNASQCTSLLGNLNAWAQRKSVIAENYASQRGYGSDKTKVAVFQESLRQQLVGGPSNAEPAYLLEYQIDSAVGEQGNARGRVRPSGTIMLGPAQPGCNTIVSLSANPTDIVVGSSSTLTVTYTNASHVWLTDQTGAIVPGTDTTGLTETNSSQTLTFTVSPIDNTSYRAQAEGSGCRAVSAEVTIIVNYPPPEIIQFNATPACINQGQSTTLNFQVRYASSITITGGGVNQTFPGNTGATITSGSLVVSPTTDTTYTITATGRGGSATGTTSVTVKQPFSIDQFISDSYCVTPGSPVNLTWANTNAETATITDSTTGATVGVTPSSGTRNFTVNSTTTFTLSISRTGCSGVETLTRQLTVNTTPVPTATFGANPSDMELGNATTLQWTSTNASTVTITPSPVAGSGMSGPQTVSASGSLTIIPTAINQSPGYTYTLTVTNNSCSPQTITKTTVVKVRPVFVPPPCPNVISFTADSCVASGGNSTLRWNVADSDFVTITGPGVNQTFSSSPIGTGSMTVTPTGDSTYTLTATRTGSCTPASPAYPTTATVNVRISQPPSVNSFIASPSVIDAGQTARLSWNESGNLSTVRITSSGGDTNTYNVPPGQRFLDVRPSSTSTYTVTVTSNDCSAQTASQALTVPVGACPAITSPFSATPSNIIRGASSTLQWGISNAAQVLLDGTPVSTTGSRVVSPNVTTTYRLSAVSGNGSCDVDQFITVNVAACPTPQIMSFTATPNAVLIGGNSMVRLAWSINDTSGTGVTITIPGAGTFTNPNTFVDITQPQSTTIYTLSVTNGCGTSSSTQTQVTANACPAPGITSFTATPSTVTIGGSQTVRLAWSVTDASGTGVSVTISGIGTWPTSTGFVDIAQPQETTTYTLTVNNGCGATATPAQVQVTVGPTATCPVLVAGAPDYVANAGSTGAVSAFPNPYSTANIQLVARHYQNDSMGINMKMTISNGNDPFMLQTPQVLTGGYHGYFGKYKFKFYMGQYSSFFSSFNAIRGIELYDSSDTLVQTVPFENISNNGSQNVYVMKGSDITTADGEVVVPYANFDAAVDKVGVAALTVRAFDQNGSGQALDTPVAAQESSFGCTEYYNNQGARNEVVAPHNNMYITAFLETYADGHVRGDASTGGMGNEIVNGYWIKTTYDYHIILSRDGVPFKEIRYSYEHTPAVPYSSPTVFEIPAAQVPAGAGPVTMWAELTGTVYNRVYTESLHATIDTTKPDDTKYPGDSPPPVPVYGRYAYIGECNGDIPGACTNQKTNNGLRW